MLGKKTKIVCTLGPASNTPEMVEKLAKEGMNIVRCNFSHEDHKTHGERIDTVSYTHLESREVRKAFLPSEGNVLVASDYSQIELRMLAHMADEQGLLDAFRHAVDIHTKTASDVFQIPLDQVDAKHRRQAKAVNFGIVYGISDFGLSQQLDISRAQAKEFIERYLQSYPNISKYMDQVISFCQEHGYTATMLGRRREVPEIHDKNYMTREFGKRAAMNAPIPVSYTHLDVYKRQQEGY